MTISKRLEHTLTTINFFALHESESGQLDGYKPKICYSSSFHFSKPEVLCKTTDKKNISN